MNIKNLIILLALLMCFTIPLISQSTRVNVKIIDKSTQEVLIGANIQCIDEVFISDVNGLCSFEPTEREVTVSYIGYETKTKNLLFNEVIQVIELTPVSSLLEMATISSSRHEVSLAETTVSLEVLQPKIIESNNLVSMDAVLEKVPGVQMVGDQINIRGGAGFSYGAGSRVMLLIDDIPALTMDGGFPNWNDVPLENIAQVEVLKGAASSLYGSAALNGIVNVRTGMPSIEPETKVSVAYTNYRSPKEGFRKWWDKDPSAVYLSFVDKRKIGKLDLVLNGNYYYLDSYNKNTKSNRGRIGVNTRYRISEKMSVSLNALYNNAESTDFFIWQDEKNTYIGLDGAESDRTINRFQIDPGMQYFSNKGYKHYWKNRLSSVQNESGNEQGVSSLSYFTEYQLQKVIPFVDVNATGGLTFSTVLSESDLYGGNKYSFSNTAGYIQLDKKLFNRLNINGGTRFESNMLNTIGADDESDISETKLVSRAGANVRLHKASYIRANWGQGYRFPTIAERYIRTNISGLIIFPNNDLKPERGWTSELGFKQGLQLGNWKGYIDIAGFIQKYKNMMEFVFVVTGENIGFQSQNIGNTSIKGIEVSVGSQSKIYEMPFSLILGYTYIDPKYDNFKKSIELGSSVDYNILKYRSKHNFKIDTEIKYRKVDFGMSLQLISSILAIDSGLEELPIVGELAGIRAFRSTHNNTRKVLGFRTGYTWNKLKIGLIMDNVLNEAYTLRPGLMEAPRNITVKLGYKF